MINYILGIFIGCFSTFAANGDWIILLISLFSINSLTGPFVYEKRI
ncbi:hypothetical protein OE105_12265 [Fervidibacillus halotolerans]|uniref:Uncharacterized protein n=2 Tax=Fervidibacillus halotolerans TaxID=2980027 RepID=A0A9E8RYJ7_9BACI|nr:hypothetical protein [Fervidibacillus halotolerans]WAA12318.1 hypothetical protein OE105_12265 [Fervidibacillus halotolerans]